MSFEYVILLHGMARTKNSMRKLEACLAGNGFQTVNEGYPSTRKTVEELAAVHLSAMVDQCMARGAVKIHMVTHSLGGIIARQYLQTRRLPPGSRIVMISPPNRGSELADAFRNWFFYRWIYGPAGRVLGAGPESLPNSLKPVSAEIGVITGNQSLNPLFSWMIPGEDDGKVAVERAKFPEMADFFVVPSSHSFIMRHPEVLTQTVFFLKNGRFSRESGK
ncbi:MAG: alpha/beta hydrolase [Desulfobacterales bacterium CG23_combo_of_CG06-09_8_20_14_all_51_8]|nr:MAG: alpha/beta hydrolase [Desulfobacterales bacterium CG23_combo_of_CG06-09_8_20_14_all_51_8]